MSDNLEAMAKALGFADAAEMNRMVAAFPLDKPTGAMRFKLWQNSDGTKDGLQRASLEVLTDSPMPSR